MPKYPQHEWHREGRSYTTASQSGPRSSCIESSSKGIYSQNNQMPRHSLQTAGSGGITTAQETRGPLARERKREDK